MNFQISQSSTQIATWLDEKYKGWIASKRGERIMYSLLIWSLASATNQPSFALTAPMLLLGVVLSAIDLLILTTHPPR